MNELIEKRDYLQYNLEILNGKLNQSFPFEPPKLIAAADELEKQIKELNKQIES